VTKDVPELTRSQRWIAKIAEDAGWLVNTHPYPEDADTELDLRMELVDPDSSVMMAVAPGEITMASWWPGVSGQRPLPILNTRDVELAIEYRGMSRVELEVLLLLCRGEDVREWPDDEAAAYRGAGGFSQGWAAVRRLRVQEILAVAGYEEPTNWQLAARQNLEVMQDYPDRLLSALDELTETQGPHLLRRRSKHQIRYDIGWDDMGNMTGWLVKDCYCDTPSRHPYPA
jgi:hypothetical protein